MLFIIATIILVTAMFIFVRMIFTDVLEILWITVQAVRFGDEEM